MIRRREYEVSDEDLMVEVTLGDDRAFDCLAARHRPWLVDYFQRQTRCHETAEDLTQIALLRAFMARRRWKPAARVTTWLMCIAKHLGMNHHRDAKRTLPRLDDNVGLAVVDHRERQPPQVAIARECGAILRRAVGDLSEHQREAIVLYYFRSVPYTDVSESVLRSTGAVRSLLTRARTKLREELTESDVHVSFCSSPSAPASVPRPTRHRREHCNSESSGQKVTNSSPQT